MYIETENVKNLMYRESAVRTLGREGFSNTCNYNCHLNKVHKVKLLTTMLKNS